MATEVQSDVDSHPSPTIDTINTTKDGDNIRRDVKDILGLEIEGLDVVKHLGPKHTKKPDLLHDDVFTPPLWMMDFKRVFVLFTIGVILAPTTKDFVHSSYLPLIRDVSQIPNFNWGEFTLNNLLHATHTFNAKKSANILGNLALLQLVLHPGYRTTQSKNKTTEPPSLPAREGSSGHMLERQQGVTKHQELRLGQQQMRQGQHELLYMVQRVLQPCTPSPGHVHHPMPAPIYVVQPSMPTYSRDHIVNAYVDFNNVKNASASFIGTLQARKLLTDNLRNDRHMQFMKLINDKCVRRNLVFVPMNANNNHWVLLVLNFKKKTEVQILNSIAKMRDKEKQKASVTTIQGIQGIQYCLDSLGTPIDLCGWKTVLYPNIRQQEDRHSCGIFMLKYTLAWDGDKMAHNFTSVSLRILSIPNCYGLIKTLLTDVHYFHLQTQINLFSWKIYSKLLHSNHNKRRLDSCKVPLSVRTITLY
ncbi:hypothetical protein C2845_PM17G09950 [Panicum miliaceum]|uniref:Ubiquitin-like protease family profile domain-containing protein n=1 Tax=Panicum miliaceum TaxID=4540 RepID=A0A3L6Q0P1_PANMI|nr:hypothetical protein C2845_PM17G09950 [Panicum miliaceum]